MDPTLPSVDINGVRAKELYKYFQPASFQTLCASKSSSLDSVLAAHAQLVAWRLNSDRAMISLIDRKTQYFVAESTHTLSLGAEGDQPGCNPAEAIWAGCSSVPKSGRLCERTLDAPPAACGGPPCFEVCDLSQDPRFKLLTFVAGPPSFKYYVGVPIQTKNGVSIGTVFALDTVVRDPLRDTEKKFLGTMADNVMTHLETLRDKEDRARAVNMNLCLATFVDQRDEIRRRKRGSSSVPNNGHRRAPSESVLESSYRLPSGIKPPSGSASAAENPTSNGPGARFTISTADNPTLKKRDEEHVKTFTNAANLLHSSLSLDDGGVLFLNDFQANASLASLPSPHVNSRKDSRLGKMESEFGCGIIAASTSDNQAGLPGQSPGARFTTPPPSELTALIKKYPRGKLFTLDAEAIYDSTSSTSSDDFTSSEVAPASRATEFRSDQAMFASHFPNARQVIFIPLWNSLSEHWSACIAYNCSDFRTINHSIEFRYCIAFCNCVAAEISRLASIDADEQKQQFIGSISHELRSPLHGILGSMEFLNETDCTSFQRSLIDTANNCAATLLDTIQQILDFSKVNAFERDALRVNRRLEARGGKGQSQILDPHLNLYSLVDLAAITEEVVEGVATGQEFNDITKLDAADVTPVNSRRRIATHASLLQEGFKSHNWDTVPSRHRWNDVEIILDFTPRSSWTFVTQAGAFRRIVMNLFGNAVKYTHKGFIKVTLDAKDIETVDDDGQSGCPSTMVTLTVEDTGKGISPEFLRSKLFTPFTQENSLNPGTGLGLSLVKQIVTMLNGEIRINSAVGAGTEVIVQLQIAPSSRMQSGTSSPSLSSGGTPSGRSKDESLDVVRNLARGKVVALFGRKALQHDSNSRARSASQHACLVKYFTGWYNFASVVEWTPSTNAHVTVVYEQDLHHVLQAQVSSQQPRRSITVVLCANSSRHASVKAHAGTGFLEFVSVPFGPYKLARCLRVALEKVLGAGHPLPAGNHENSVRFLKDSLARVALVENGPFGTVDNELSPPRGPMALQGRRDSENTLHATEFHSPSPVKEIVSNGSISPTDNSPIAMIYRRRSVDNSSDALGGVDIPKPFRPETPRSFSNSKSEIIFSEPTTSSPTSDAGARMNAHGGFIATGASPAVRALSPRLLLVDDNKVNLRLLQTYMKQRGYSKVHCAEDGAEAVSVFHSLITNSPPEPPDIILMDISMPVLDGFAATQEIRQIEAEVAKSLSPLQRPLPSLIIALTGFASGRDQSQAFMSGFDLYMTKPVSFKEVGRLLDNWQANGGNAKPAAMDGPVSSSPIGIGISTRGEPRAS